MARRSGLRESDSVIEGKIRELAKRQPAIRSESEEFSERVAETVRDHTPVDEGTARASIKVAYAGEDNGLPQYHVTSDYWKFPFLEYGTGADTKEGSKYGPDTPTPEFAPFGNAAAYYGGTTR